MKNVKPRRLIITILSLLVTFTIHSQIIEISYHLGFDDVDEINGQQIRFGNVRNEKLKYSLDKKEKFYKSTKLIIEKEKWAYENVDFTKNILEDNLSELRISKKVSTREFDKILKLINILEVNNDTKFDSNYIHKQILSKWNEKTFELNKCEIRRMNKIALKEDFTMNSNYLIERITKYIKEKNSGILVSSVVQRLTMSFKLNEKTYSISQNSIGGLNVTWQIEIDDKTYFVISPELNKLIYRFIPKRMSVKKRIKEFVKFEELKKAFQK